MLQNSRTARRLFNRIRRLSDQQLAAYNLIVGLYPKEPGLKVAVVKYLLGESLRHYETTMLRRLGILR